MIITRSPLRISLGGGGTDLPSYYREHTGFLVAAAIDKYVYITLHQTFVSDLIIKYSKLERTNSVDAIEHPIIREAMRLLGVPAAALELSSMADIPAGTARSRRGRSKSARKRSSTWKTTSSYFSRATRVRPPKSSRNRTTRARPPTRIWWITCTS